jgi:hypothetical protein
MERGFEGDQGQACEKLTTQAMDSIPKDVRDDRDILSVMDLLALTDSVNTSGKAGAQILHLPLGDDSPPWGR